MPKVSQYEFKYDGRDFVDLSTLITSQFHFLAMVDEIQKKYYPEANLKVKVGGFSKGSFIVDLLLETTWKDELFKKENLDVVAKVIGILTGVVTLKMALKGNKAKQIEEKGSTYEITTGDNSTVHIDKRAFHIYQDSASLNKALESNFELLDEDPEVKGVSVKKKDSKIDEPYLDVKREQFKELTQRNPYMDTNQQDERRINETVFIKKANLMPEKGRVWKWEFIHKGRDIKANMEDWSFANEVEMGNVRFGQGDRLIVDLVIGMKFDKKFNTFIESGRFTIAKVHQFIQRDHQVSLKFD